jgi:hypothetical protein
MIGNRTIEYISILNRDSELDSPHASELTQLLNYDLTDTIQLVFTGLFCDLNFKLLSNTLMLK